MNWKQILTAINLPTSKENIRHASALAEIYKLLLEIKDKVQYVNSEDTIMYFGKNFDSCTGTEIPRKLFTVHTNYNAKYVFSIPKDNSFCTLICDLLGIKVNENAKVIKPSFTESILVGSEIIEAINTAAKFVCKDDLRPVLCCILLDVNDGKMKVVSTDANRLFISKEIECSAKDMQIVIHAPLNKLPAIKDDLIQIDISKEFIAIGNNKVNIFDGKYVAYTAVLPQYDKYMLFDKKEMLQSIKQLMPYTNKITNNLQFHLNGSISINASNDYMGTDSKCELYHSIKTFPDMDVDFNAKFLQSILKEIKSPEVMFYSSGNNNRSVILKGTEDKQQFILMPILK